MRETLHFHELKEANLLPSPEGVRLAIMQLCQRPDVSLTELARQVQADPVLSGRLLKMANFANPCKTRPIAGIGTEALVLVGIQAIRLLALGLSLTSAYSRGKCPGFGYEKFWSRSAAMACAAQALAERLRIAPPAEMFTCGLLAGIGRLGLASARPHAYGELLAAPSSVAALSSLLPSALPSLQAERERFGLDHLQLGAEMMADWGLPRLFIDAVMHHETPAGSGFVAGSRQQRLVELLALAATIADACTAPASERLLLLRSALHSPLVQELDRERIEVAAVQASLEWQEWCLVLGVPAGTPLPLLPAEAESDIETEAAANVAPHAAAERVSAAGAVPLRYSTSPAFSQLSNRKNL